MEMRPEVAVAPAPPTPTVVPVIEKCEITPPAKGITSSVSANGPTETVAPKQSFWGRAKRFVERGFSNVGDFVAGEEPVILPTGKDYLMGDDIREKAAPMEAKAAAASAVLIAAAVEAAGAGGAAGAVGKVGTKVIARAIKSGDSVSSFARKTDGMDLASKAGLADRPALIERKVDIPGIPKESAVKQTKVQQTVSSFKPIREIPKDATHSGVFHKEVEFTYKKTGQTFKVTQRNDIDPNYVVTLKDGKQVTNRELMREGKAPRTNLGAKVILHHIGQDAKGPLTEVTEYSHLDALHGQYGVNEPHPTNPVIRKIFDPIREAYWKTYGETFK
jgi:hypothetical protein